MIRFLFRFVGLLLLALAFIFVVYDGIRSISDGNVLLTTTQQIWNIVDDSSLQAFQVLIERFAGVDIWRFGLVPLLNQPVSALFFVLGVVLIVLGRKKRPLIGYARD
jgi:hypothetical protein